MNDYFQEIAAEADRSPEEVCGFLLSTQDGSLTAYPSRNVSDRDRKTSFAISPLDYLDAVRTQRLVALYHSHVEVDHKFSPEDVSTADAIKLPMFVYSKVSRKFNYYRPVNIIAPLENRPFILGVHDCVSLVSDFVQLKKGVEIPFFIRTLRELQHGFAGCFSTLLDLGFRQVKTPEPGDVLLMSIASHNVNHAAVLLEPDLIVHQLMGRLSSKQSFSQSWQTATRAIFRPPTLPVKK